MNKNGMVISWALLFFCGCDSDKFFSYNYSAEQFVELSTVTGTVTNLFTGDPVREATVTIGAQSTLTNSDGVYRLDYALTADDELGREVPISISAENYHSFSTSRQFFPQPVELNFRLKYGAPIIEAISFFDLTYCQAMVFDYQGAEDIDTVYAEIAYLDTITNLVTARFTLGLQRKQGVDANRAYYQLEVARQDPQYGNASPAVTVTAVDKSGFSDRDEHINNEDFDPDTLLFDPDL
jgi:hypothetical protein